MDKQKILKKVRVVLMILLYLACIGAFFFVGNIELWSGVAAVLAAALAAVYFIEGKRKPAVFVLLAAAVLEVIWILAKWYLFYLLGLYIMIITVIYMTAAMIKENKNPDKKKGLADRIKVCMGVAASILILAFTCFLSVTAATSVPFIKFMQKNMMGGAGNYYEPKENIINEIEAGTIISNIEYGTEYPNSYLDIYLTDVGSPEEAPTYIFFHGGGYVWGDKQEGDPNGGSDKGLQWYFQQFVKNGYNVVAPNYALGPDYKYPTPVKQMSQMIGFLNKNASEYRLNMDHVILGGNSGGGQLAGIMACIQTDEKYSKQIGIQPVLDPESLKAVVFSSALLDNERSYRTNDLGADFLFLQCGKAYYGWDLLERKTGIVNMIDHVTDQFPPSFISDGNSGTFYDQAFDLHEQLDDLNVPNEINWYPVSEEKLGHDFETQATLYSSENLEKLLAFLEKETK